MQLWRARSLDPEAGVGLAFRVVLGPQTLILLPTPESPKPARAFLWWLIGEDCRLAPFYDLELTAMWPKASYYKNPHFVLKGITRVLSRLYKATIPTLQNCITYFGPSLMS